MILLINVVIIVAYIIDKEMDQHPGLKFFTALFKEYGTPLTLLSMFGFILFFWTSADQKKEIVDTWLLLKATNHAVCVFIIAGEGMIILFGALYLIGMLNMRKRENNRIGEEKSKWQELALGMKLNSSK